MSRPSSTTLDRPTVPPTRAAALSPTPPGPEGDAERMPTLRGHAGVAEFAASLGIPAVSARYVKQASEAGELPSFRVANKLHYSRADVREWLLSLRRS